MTYESIDPVTSAVLRRDLANDDLATACRAMVSGSLYGSEDDAVLVESTAIAWLRENRSKWYRINACNAMQDLVRRFRVLDVATLLPLLREQATHEDTKGAAENAIDAILYWKPSQRGAE